MSIEGLAFEALAWRAGGEGPAGRAEILRGTVRVLPALPLVTENAFSGASGLVRPAGSATPGAPPRPEPGGAEPNAIANGRPDGVFATVWGPAGRGSLLLAAGDLFVLVRGAPQLPIGAEVFVFWEAGPEMITGPFPVALAALGAKTENPLERTVYGATGGAGTATEERGSQEPLGEPRTQRSATEGPGSNRSVPEDSSVTMRAQTVSGPATSLPARLAGVEPPSLPLAFVLEELAGRLGLCREVGDEEKGGEDRRGNQEEGRSLLEIDFPVLGRIRLELAWSPRSIELRLTGADRFAEVDRAAIVRAFADGLALAGARGRIVIVDRARS
ncbi:MAG: hypothetical protein NZ704_10735 [Geminicoccaceae bacterium]|nr:hypothetical protein [Geminicoccaceae bacterium]